jgi:hypothetical protein
MRERDLPGVPSTLVSADEDPRPSASTVPNILATVQHQHLVIHPPGIHAATVHHPSLTWSICNSCHRSLTRAKLPANTLANNLFLGDVPPELADLTIIEEAMIARRQAKVTVIHLKEDRHSSNGLSNSATLPTSQRAL